MIIGSPSIKQADNLKMIIYAKAVEGGVKGRSLALRCFQKY
jgi:hypothetical protein